jgi:hypothetical protein
VYAGIWPFLGPIFDAVSLGIQTAATLTESGPLGSSGSRPIGMTRNPDNNRSFVFNPQVLLLDYARAETAVSTGGIGGRPGALSMQFRDDPTLRGNCELFLTVERLYYLDLGEAGPFADGTLLREATRPEIYVIFGGARFWIPDGTVLERYGGWGAVRGVADGVIAQSTRTIPTDGTLLREISQRHVYVIQEGQRRHVPSATVLQGLGGWSQVRVIPDGTILAISEGRPIPEGPPIN